MSPLVTGIALQKVTRKGGEMEAALLGRSGGQGNRQE